MPDHTINWSTAIVDLESEGLTLRVQVEPGVATDWHEHFNDEAKRGSREARGHMWGSVGVWGETILVQQLEEGAESALREYLTDLVAVTDRQVSVARKAKADRELKEAQEAETLGGVAERMTQRFRGN